jgi:glutathione S-transferase
MHPILHTVIRLIFHQIIAISSLIFTTTSRLLDQTTRANISVKETKIDLFTSGTPNRTTESYILEELGLSYKVHNIDLAKDQPKADWYTKINSNGRISALVDNTPGVGNGKRVFESGALMLYFCEKYDTDYRISFPYDSDEYWECMSWHIWMQSGLWPMQRQANHSYPYSPEKIEYSIDRYQTETKRLFGVLDDRLKEQERRGLGLWIVGGKCTFADLDIFCWVNWAEWAGVGLDAFPCLKKWLGIIQERNAVKRVVDVPDKFEMKEAMKTNEGEKGHAKHHSNWVMQGQNEDKR